MSVDGNRVDLLPVEPHDEVHTTGSIKYTVADPIVKSPEYCPAELSDTNNVTDGREI